jgi:hypothetical protein
MLRLYVLCAWAAVAGKAAMATAAAAAALVGKIILPSFRAHLTRWSLAPRAQPAIL